MLKYSNNLLKNKVKTLIYTKSSLTTRNFDLIPGPKYYPFIGNLFSLKKYGRIISNSLFILKQIKIIFLYK